MTRRLSGLGVVIDGAVTSGALQTLTGAYILPTSALYAGMLYGGPIRLVGVTHHEATDLTSTSFYHETPAGDDRLLLVSAVYQDTMGVASLVFGSVGTGDGQFDSPHGIAIDSDGNIFVVDNDNNRIQKFDSSGAYVTKWGSSGTGNGEFDEPEYIAVSSAGYVYVTDLDNHRVQKFDTDGVYISQWGILGSGNGEFNRPYGITVDNDGAVYVADSLNSRIQKFDADGVYITQWGSLGTGNGEFSLGLRGIACGPGGNIYTIDNVLNRVQVFDSTGAFVSTFGTSGIGNGQFDGCYSIAINKSGGVYVTDFSSHRVQRFSPSYEFASKWGVYGTGNGQFKLPLGVAISPDGDVYVTDNSNHRVQKFNAGLKLNAAQYGGVPMEVGPLVDGGSYYQAFYTLVNPDVGSAEFALTTPTGPDALLITAMSFNGVEGVTTDYTAPDAGRAETETSTTILQVSHNRLYPSQTLSVFGLLYETAGTTLTAASGNYLYSTRNVNTLYHVLGFKPTQARTTSNLTFGATASPAVTPRISAVIHLEGARGDLTGAYIAPTSTVYAGVIDGGVQVIKGAYITPTSTLYAGRLTHVLTGAYISPTSAVYAGQLNQYLEGEYIEPTSFLMAGIISTEGETQYLYGSFIGMGQPNMLGGAYIEPTSVCYAGEIIANIVLEGAYISPTSTVYAGVLTRHDYTGTGAVYAGVIFNVP